MYNNIDKNIDKETEKNKEINKNIEDAIKLAGDIFKVVSDKQFIEKFDEDTRHKVVVDKYPNFSKAYPLIVRYIARDLKYSEKAFRKFLDKLKTNPGKGMQGFIERQADYAKYLYIEDHKQYGRPWSAEKAKQIWELEYNNMNSSIKKLEKEEKLAKNEFKEERERNVKQKKKELLDFVNMMDPPMENEDDDELNLDLNMDITNLSKKDLILFIRELRDYRLSFETETKIPNIKIDELNLDELRNYINEIRLEINELIKLEKEKSKEIPIENEKLKEKQSNEVIINHEEWISDIIKYHNKQNGMKNKKK